VGGARSSRHDDTYPVSKYLCVLGGAGRLAGQLVVDAFTGAGGNAVQLAAACGAVLGLDTSAARLAAAAHNAALYGVAQRLDLIVCDALSVLPRLRQARAVLGYQSLRVSNPVRMQPWHVTGLVCGAAGHGRLPGPACSWCADSTAMPGQGAACPAGACRRVQCSRIYTEPASPSLKRTARLTFSAHLPDAQLAVTCRRTLCSCRRLGAARRMPPRAAASPSQATWAGWASA